MCPLVRSHEERRMVHSFTGELLSGQTIISVTGEWDFTEGVGNRQDWSGHVTPTNADGIMPGNYELRMKHGPTVMILITAGGSGTVRFAGDGDPPSK